MLESLRVTKCTLSYNYLCFVAINFRFVDNFETDGMSHFIRDERTHSRNHIYRNICFLVLVVL